MKRKLIRQGGGGYTIYLPKKWVDQRHLKAGDHVNIDQRENALILKTTAKIKEQTTIKLEESSKQYIYIKLSHIYRMGFDKITVHFEDPAAIRKITSITNNYLLGFEITHREKNKCVLENITEPTEEKFSVLLRRIFLQIKETHDAIKEDITNNKKQNWDDLKALRISIDKHIFFCRRTISKKANVEENAVLHWELLTFLMHIQHAYHYLYEHYYKNCKKLHKETVEIFNQLENYYDKYYRAYFEKNTMLLDKIQKQKGDLQEQIHTALQNKRNKDKIILTKLAILVRLVQVGGSPIRALYAAVHTQSKH